MRASFRFTYRLCFSPCGNYLLGETRDGESVQFCLTSRGILLGVKPLLALRDSLFDDNRSQDSDSRSLAKRVAEEQLIGQGQVSQLIPLTAGSAAVTVGQTGHRALHALALKRNGDLSLSELDQDGRLVARSVSRLPAWAMNPSKCVRVSSTDHTSGAVNIIFTSKPQDRYDIGRPARDEDYAAIYRREESELQPWRKQRGRGSGTKRKFLQEAEWNGPGRYGPDGKRRAIETSSPGQLEVNITDRS